VALGLPFLDIMSAQAGSSVFPKRFIVFFSPNGTIYDEWKPAPGDLTASTLPRILAPLENDKSDILVLSGVDAPSGESDGPGEGHLRGIGSMLTGAHLQPGDKYGDEVSRSNGADGISVDQEIANRVGQTTKFQSLEFGVQTNDPANAYCCMCYAGPDQFIPPEQDPHAAFTRIFADLDPSAAQAAEKLRLRRHTVLDAVAHDLTSLQKKLGAEDRRTLDAHLTTVREIEQRLDILAQLGGSCAMPAEPGPIEPFYTLENYPEIGKLQMDLLAMSLACDLTHVASIQWSYAVGTAVFSWLNIFEDHHSLSHLEGDEVPREQLIQVNTWFAEQLAYLIAQLRAIPEGDSTLFDNSVILWCNDLGSGAAHSHTDIPFLLAGSCAGYFQTGRHIVYNAQPHNNLLLSLIHAMGAEDVTTFGYPEFCTGPLTDLT
jgi:hypothetical protein